MRISPEHARFIAMATDEGGTWNLTEQDGAALDWAMNEIENLRSELEKLRNPARQPELAHATKTAGPTGMKEAEPEGIAFMVTNKMRKQLGDLGYSLDDIHAMTPANAHAALQAGKGKRANKADTNRPEH